MDFNDTPEEAAFRAEARALLERQRRAAARRLRDVAEPLSATTLKGWSAPRSSSARRRRPGFAGAALARGVRRPRAAADLPGDLRPGRDALPRPARLLRDRPGHVHADPVQPTRPRSRSAGTRQPRCAATRCGASSSPSPAPAPTWPGLRTRAVRDGDDWVDQRPEDLDVGRALGRLGHPGHAQRSQGAPSTRASRSSSST